MASTCGGYIFGTDTVKFGGKGDMIVTNYTLEAQPQFQAQAKDDTGETVALVSGKSTGTASVSGYMNKGIQAPEINDSFTLDGHTMWVDRVKLLKSSEDFQKLEVTARFWEKLTTAC